MASSEHVAAQFGRAVALRNAGQSREAADLLIELLQGELSRRQCAAVTGLLAGLVLYDLNEPARAAPLCRASVNLSPRSELVSLALFHAMWRLQRPLEAFREMRRFIRLVGQSSEYDRLVHEIAESTPNPEVVSDAIRRFTTQENESGNPLVLGGILATPDDRDSK